MDLPTWLQSVISSPEFTALLLTTFAGIVTGVVSWVAVQFRKNILHNLSATDYALLRAIAADAVKYAEQAFKDSDGPAKLAAAIAAADTMIASYGIHVTVEQLAKIIEAAVYAETIASPLPEVPVVPDP
jgi:energy-converting hydrogenase Eha subunit G